MEEPETTMVEVRQEELIVSPTSHNQNPCSTTTAHFLKPIHGFKETQLPKLPSQCVSSLEQPSFEPIALPLRISFHGWRCRAKNWSSWIEKMASLHESTWRKAGIYEAIMNSSYHIKRNSDLVLGLAEKWCCETKTFIFSWGETSVTLEDVMILGGFSVLGSPVFTPVETEESREVEESLKNARIEIVRSKAKKACPRLWMAKFKDSGSEIEHEAFLSFWLSRYVFTNAHETIREHVFSVAVHLARGTKLALAPSVLASLYRDLCLLKDAITASTKLGKEEAFTLTIWSPFQLVQVWAWERFVEVRPKPNSIAKGQPRLAQWHDVSCKVENVRLALESASQSFEWRPYATRIDNWKQPKFYRENEVCISITPCLDKELETFARCLKVSELVGFDCVEQYLPHRVAMQFGIDQDIPAFVPRLDETPQIAWLNYCESLTGVKLYIPSQLYKAGVSARYSKWWKQSVLESRRTGKELKKSTKNPKGKKQGKSSSGCHGFHQKIESVHGKIESNDALQLDDVNDTSNACFPLKKSKSVSQILEEKQVGNKGSSTTPGSYKRNSNKSAKNLKGNKKDESTKTLKRKEKDDNESASPSFSKKRLKKSAENSSEMKKDAPVSASSRLSIRSSKKSAQVMRDEEGSSDSPFHALPSVNTKKPPRTAKRRKGSSSFTPTGLAPNSDGKEAEDSPEDNNNPTIAEMMRSCKKRGKVAPKDYDEDGNPSSHSQSLSSTIADDEVIKYFEPLAILAEQVIHDDSVLRGVGAFQNACKEQKEQEMMLEEIVPGESKATIKCANEDNPEHQIHEMISTNDVEGECSCYAVDIPGLKLEARISRLEKLVEELKAMRPMMSKESAVAMRSTYLV